MIDEVQDRVERVFNALIQEHMDLLLVLMAERDKQPEEQRVRMDRVVRSLGGCVVEEQLTQSGRPVPMLVDEAGEVPLIRLNASMLARVEDDGVRSLFMHPISDMLDLPLTAVALVLQYDDDKQIRNIYHSAVRRLSTKTTRATEVPAVVELRVSMFMHRLRQLTRQLGPTSTVLLPPANSLTEAVLHWPGGWPEWLDIRTDPTIRLTREAIENLLRDVEGVPATETIMEGFWESLDLSPMSFLKQFGRLLRSKRAPVSQDFMAHVIEVVAPGQLADISPMHKWPAFAELQEAWETLCQYEFDSLGHHLQAEREVPVISTLEPPIDTMALRLPDSLPWSYPLVCWSVREVNALRDLLMGFVQAHRAERSEEDLASLVIESRDDRAEPPLKVTAPLKRIDMQVIGTDIAVPEGYDVLMDRVYESVFQRQLLMFRELDEAEQRDALSRLRGSYDGFFPKTKEVWARRLQGWDTQPPEEALRRLATAARTILDCPVLFDPFKSAEVAQLRMMPTFVFVVGLSEHLERVPFRIPLNTLVATSATGAPPLILRMVQAPDAIDEPCTWLCDRKLTMDTLQGQPVQLTLRAVDGSMLRMLAYE